MPGGLNKDGGISFTRKRNYDDKKKEPEMFSRKAPEESDEEVEEVVEEFESPDPEFLSRQARLDAKLLTAKKVNYSGFAVNGSSIVFMLFGLNSIATDPNTAELVNLINKVFKLNINYDAVVDVLEQFKAHIVACAGSVQLFLGYWQQTRRRMKEADTEDTWSFINEELGKLGI